MRSSVWSKPTAKDGRWFTNSASQLFIIVTILVALLVGVLADVVLGLFGLYASVLIISSIIMALIFILRQDELAAALIIAVHLNVDWYLGFRVISLAMTLALLCSCYIGRSSMRPWVRPRSLWLWLLFLGLTIIPAIRGATNLYDTLFYYPNIIFGALLMFWMGTIIARSPASIRLFFSMLSVYCTLVAIHTIIQARTGIFLFGSEHLSTYIANQANNHLPGHLDVARVGSFFIDPDWAGTFFAMAIFIPIGLLVESSSPLAKVLYLTEAVLISLALLFTYSAGSWLAASVAAVIFLVLLGGMRYRVQFLVCLTAAAIVVLIGFSSHLNLLLEHASDPIELSSRVGAWQTALRVVTAFPLTGVGLGGQAYLLNAVPYFVPEQLIPLGHPHNSYLEIAAMAGLPVLFVLAAILVLNMRWALHNWTLSDPGNRCLFAAGLAAVITLSFNSFSVNAWTLPPLSAIGWVILGCLSSPLLTKSQVGQTTKVQHERGLIPSMKPGMEREG